MLNMTGGKLRWQEKNDDGGRKTCYTCPIVIFVVLGYILTVAQHYCHLLKSFLRFLVVLL